MSEATLSAPLVDTHAHLMDAAYEADFEAVLHRADAAGVGGFICVGYGLETSRQAVALAARLPNAWATVGLHPNDLAITDAAARTEIAELARSPRVVGVGETGLDYYRDWTTPADQRRSLEWHLRLAEETHLPAIIHNRDADADVIDLLEASAARRPSGEVPGLLHCFSSTDVDYLSRALAAGYYTSFAGPVTFRNGGAVREMVARVPEDRLLVETDCPYLAPAPHRGRRNAPAYVRHTAERIAMVRGESLDSLSTALWNNVRQVFPSVSGLTGTAEAAA